MRVSSCLVREEGRGGLVPVLLERRVSSCLVYYLSWYLRASLARQRCLMASRKGATVALLMDTSRGESGSQPVIPASRCAHRNGLPGRKFFRLGCSLVG